MLNLTPKKMLESKFIPGKTKFRKILFLITIVALAARLVTLFGEHPVEVKYDEIDYYMLGKNLYEGKGFVAHERTQVQFQGGEPGDPTAYRSIILPAFLAGHFFIFGHDLLPPRLTLVILSSLCCILIGLIGRMMHSPGAGLIAALIWAFYPPALFSWYSADRILTEGLGIFFVLWSFYYLLKVFRNYSFWPTAVAGILFGVAVLLRGYLALTIPLIVGYLFFFAEKKKFMSAFVFGLFATIILSAWITRNYFVMGKPVLSTQTDSFYWGNNEFSRGSSNNDVFIMKPWTAPSVQKLVQKYPGIENFSEIKLSEVWPKEGFLYLKENPKQALWLLYKKTVGYVLPFQLWSVGFYKIHYVYLLLFLATVAAFWLVKSRKEYFLLLLPFLGGWIACVLTIAMDRYRYTAEPFIIVTGVIGILELYYRFKNKGRQPLPENLHHPNAS